MGVKGTRLSGSPSQDAGSTPATSKFCNSCECEKPISDFHSNGHQPSGKKKYKAKCKACERINLRESYWKIIEEHFGSWKCQVCGFWGHPYQMDCHHLDPDNKKYEIAKLRGKDPQKLREELKKCQLLCANCHRLA